MKKFIGWAVGLILLALVAGGAAAVFLNGNGNGDPAGNNQAVQTTDTELRVPLRILEAPNDATLALVPVTINGEGPFLFGLDTGASQTVVDDDIVNQLGLQRLGPAGQVRGVAGRISATLVRIENWRMGDVALPSEEIVTFDLGEPQGSGLAGLLGSDILSEFEAVTVDYKDEVLRLESRP